MRLKDSKRVAAGRTAKLVGDLHEGWVEQQLDKALHLGILAHHYHNQPTARYINGQLRLTAPGVSDHTGVLEKCVVAGWNHAAPLAVEDKTAKDRNFYRSEVTKEQQEHLEASARAEGLSLLAVCFREHGVADLPAFARFAIPWLEVPWRKLRSAESIDADMPELRKWLVHPECFLLKWHTGGKRSGNWLPAPQRRVYATE